MSSCWCFGMSSTCCAAMPGERSSGTPIALCLPPRRATYRGLLGCHFWSRHGRSCVGTKRLCDGSGGNQERVPDGRDSRRRSGSLCFDSPARTQAGGIAGSAENLPSLVSRHHRRVSGVCLSGRGWVRRRDAPDRAGASSCTRRRKASLPAIFSRSRRCSCAATTCCYSSSTPLAGSGSRGARPTLTAAG